jgi:drug/metabolite transporter (DMT)-like permease
MPPSVGRVKTSGASLCVLAAVILGCSVPVSRSLLSFPTMTGQALRYAVAAAALGTLVRLRTRLRVRLRARRPAGPARRPAASARPGPRELARPGSRHPARPGPRHPARSGPRELVRLAALAATGLAGFNVCLLAALRHADAPVVGTIVGATPLLLAVLGPALRRQRPSPRLVAAATVVVAGAALVEGGGNADAAGLAYALGALAGEAAFSLLAAPLLPRLGPVRVSAWTCALAVPMLAAGAVLAGEPLRMPRSGELAALLYLGLVLTVLAFMAWYAGLARLGVERAGICFGIMPVAALAATAVLDGRVPPPAQITGVLLVGAGLAAGLGMSRLGSSRLGSSHVGSSHVGSSRATLDGADRVGVGEGGLAQRALGVEPAVAGRGHDGE